MYISIHILQKETASDLPFGKKMFIKNKKKCHLILMKKRHFNPW